MRFTALIELLYHRLALANPVRPARRQQRSFVPCLDVLEDRTLLSAVSFGPPSITLPQLGKRVATPWRWGTSTTTASSTSP
jgi:hypothetical protein